MNTSQRLTGYDLFKLIVAIILFILFLLLNRKPEPDIPSPGFTPSSNQNSTTVSATRSEATDAVLSSLTLIETADPAATAQPTLATTATAEPTVTDLSSPTPTLTVELTATTRPSPTPTSVAPITSTPEVGAVDATACDSASSHSRLKVGDKAVLLRRLNFRSSPGIQENWLRTNLAGTQVEVMGGPQCIPYVDGAYIWWQIKLADGTIGWSAEASQFGSFYFMEPGK